MTWGLWDPGVRKYKAMSGGGLLGRSWAAACVSDGYSREDAETQVRCCFQVASVVSDSVRPLDGRPPGSPIPGILQARTLEWVAISFSNA